MKIAVVVGRFPSVSETFILSEIVWLIEQGHEVEILALRQGPAGTLHPEIEHYDLLSRTRYLAAMPSGVRRVLFAAGPLLRVLRHRPGLIGGLLNTRRFGREARSLQLLYAGASLLDGDLGFDVIHAHFGPHGALAAALRALGLVRGAVVTTFHGADVAMGQRRDPARYRALFDSGDRFLTVSRLWRERLIEAGAPASRVVVHHMGVDTTVHRPGRPAASNDPTKLISVCRLTEKKGIRYALEALASLHGHPFVYHVVGDGPLLTDLETLAQQLGIMDKVVFHGAQPAPAVKALLDASQLFLLPSVTAQNGDQEGVPVALMEAMAAGLPVVSTFHSGIPELVDDGVSGRLVPERDVGALAKAIESLIGDTSQRVAMGYQARKKVEREFDANQLYEELERIFLRTQREGTRAASAVNTVSEGV